MKEKRSLQYKEHHPYHETGKSSTMLWSFISAKGVRKLTEIEEMKEKENYLDVFSENLKSLGKQLGLRCCWTFMLDDESKHI